MSTSNNKLAVTCRAVLGLFAFGSSLVGARNALSTGRSQDFQWSGTHMLLAHVDPWQDFLRGDPLHGILLLQIPNYLHALYLLLIPLGLLPFTVAKTCWLVCNLCFAVASAVLAGRFYGLPGRGVWLALCLFLLSTPVRNTLGNGQHGLLVLLFWCFALLSPTLTNARAVVAGLGYIKLSFAPALLLYFLLKRQFRAVLLSLLVPVLATLVVWLWLTGGHDPGGLFRFALEPFQVSQTGYFARGGDSNLMDVLDLPLRKAGLSLPVVDQWEIVMATALCALVLYFGIARCPQSSTRYQVALLATASVTLFRHHAYDQVILLLPLCFALARWRRVEAKVILAVLVWLFYLHHLVELLNLPTRLLYLPEFFLLLGAGAMLYKLRDSPAEPSEHAFLSTPNLATGV